MTQKLLNDFINILKVGGIWLLELVHDLQGLFAKLNVPRIYSKVYLAERARELENSLHGLYVDDCLWHGITTATYAIKYSVTRDMLDLESLERCVLGLARCCFWTVDQASGRLVGTYFLWKYGNISHRKIAKSLIVQLADKLAINDNKLSEKLENGYLTNPLNLTLCLAIYKVAYEFTDEPWYLARYDRLVEKYESLIPYANLGRPWSENKRLAHMAAMHYSILCDLETDHDLHRKYLGGLLRTWKMERTTVAPWIYFLMRRVCLCDPADLDLCRLFMKKWMVYNPNDPRDNGIFSLFAYWGLRSLRIIGASE